MSWRSSASAVNAEIAIGVSWSGSTRLRAVTTISSSAETLSAASDIAGDAATMRQQLRNIAARSVRLDLRAWASDMTILLLESGLSTPLVLRSSDVGPCPA